MKPLIVSLYDYTGLMVEPWRRAGYPCLIVDAQHPEGVAEDTKKPGLFRTGLWLARNQDTLAALDAAIAAVPADGVGAVFGFPPCDDMAVSGARWFKSKLKADPDCQRKAMRRARLVEDLGKRYDAPWLAENPISILSTLWRKPDFIFNPCDYGGWISPDAVVHPEYPDILPPQDAYNKTTCIWMGNGMLQPTARRVEPVAADFPGFTKLGGKSLRTKNIRSATPRGFAEAVFGTMSPEIQK